MTSESNLDDVRLLPIANFTRVITTTFALAISTAIVAVAETPNVGAGVEKAAEKSRTKRKPASINKICPEVGNQPDDLDRKMALDMRDSYLMGYPRSWGLAPEQQRSKALSFRPNTQPSEVRMDRAVIVVKTKKLADIAPVSYSCRYINPKNKKEIIEDSSSPSDPCITGELVRLAKYKIPLDQIVAIKYYGESGYRKFDRSIFGNLSDDFIEWGFYFHRYQGEGSISNGVGCGHSWSGPEFFKLNIADRKLTNLVVEVYNPSKHGKMSLP